MKQNYDGYYEGRRFKKERTSITGKIPRAFFSDKTLSLLLLCYSSAHASLKCVCEPLYASGNHTLIGSKIKSFKVKLEITKTS